MLINATAINVLAINEGLVTNMFIGSGTLEFPKFEISGRGSFTAPTQKHLNAGAKNRRFLEQLYGWGSLDLNEPFDRHDCCPDCEPVPAGPREPTQPSPVDIAASSPPAPVISEDEVPSQIIELTVSRPRTMFGSLARRRPQTSDQGRIRIEARNPEPNVVIRPTSQAPRQIIHKPEVNEQPKQEPRIKKSYHVRQR